MSAGLLYSELLADPPDGHLGVTFLREMDAERLYGLCLVMVPEADMADDLFLLVQDERDLRLRATRWRLKHGYGPLPEEISPATLDEVQREHALHLARRGRLRRQIRSVAAAAGAVALALLVLIGWQRANSTAPPRGLASALAVPTGMESDPSFSGTPIGSNQVGGLTLTVYKASGAPGDVTVWWSLTGPSAAEAAKTFTPRFFGVETKPDTVLSSGRQDRVYGKSRFRLQLTSGHPIAFGGEIGERRLWVTVPAPYQPHMRTQTVVLLNKPVTVDGQRATIHTIAHDDRVTGIIMERPIPAGSDFEVGQLRVGQKSVLFLQRVENSTDPEYVGFAFGPLPGGATELELQVKRGTSSVWISVDLKEYPTHSATVQPSPAQTGTPGR